MTDKDKIEEVLRNAPNGVEPRADLADDAAALAQKLYADKPKKTKKKWKLATVFSCLAACVFVAVFVPVYYRLQPQKPVIRYYTDVDLTKEDLLDTDLFVTQNHLNIKYFQNASQSYLNRITETSEPAIIEQHYLYFDSDNYDVVELGICLTNDDFERYNLFHDCSNLMTVNDIKIKYRITESANRYSIFAVCQVESYRYYWQITALQGEERIEYYINYLFGNE